VAKDAKTLPPPPPPEREGAAGIMRPFLAAVWVYVAGYLPRIADHLGGYIPPWVMPVLGLAAGAVGYRQARLEWSPREFDKRLQDMAKLLAIVSGIGMAGWLYYAADAGPLPAAGVLVILTLPLAAWYWSLHRSSAKSEAAIIAAGPTPMVYRPPNAWEQIFEAAGLTAVTVHAKETLAGATLVVRPAPDEPWSTNDITQRAEKLALQIAVHRPAIDITQNAVRIEPGETLPRTLVHISWKHPLRVTLPYEPAGPSDIREAQPLGMDETGKAVTARLPAQNGQIVSATDGGKSVATNGQIARAGECDNALVIVAGTEKLLPLVYPWLAPWLEGMIDRPPIDGVVGQNPLDVLDMLADLYLIVKRRNARNTRKSKHVPSRRSPAIIVFIEEATDLMRIKDKVTTFDGKEWTVTQLVERICASDRSASVAIYFSQQFALIDALGQNGNEIMRHISLRICGRTNSAYDGTATLPALRATFDSTQLMDNTLLLQASYEIPRVMPWKAYYLEDELIEPVAIRNSKWRPELEPEIAAECQWWPTRWHDGRLPELVEECEGEGLTWPGTHGDIDRSETKTEAGAPMAMTASTDDLEDMVRSTDQTVDTINRIIASYHELPEPFASIDDVLSLPGAPAEWVSTARLAMVLGRVDPNADEEEKRKAAWTLGRELRAIVPNLQTTNPRADGKDEAGNTRKRNGYTVVRLKAACAALKRGIVLPPDLSGDTAAESDSGPDAATSA
jgi:hypothetical protein